MKQNIGFRAWFYFRTGWATYFAFIFAAINTLTVTYFLAIENYPFLNNIFPTFIHYVIIITLIGVPLLIAIGYVHFKKTPSFRAETDVSMETDPYRRRMVVNSEISVTLNLKLTEMLLKLLRNEELSKEQVDEINHLKNILSALVKERSFSDKKDLEFYEKIDEFNKKSSEF
jgi:hypothetical protein